MSGIMASIRNWIKIYRISDLYKNLNYGPDDYWTPVARPP